MLKLAYLREVTNVDIAQDQIRIYIKYDYSLIIFRLTCPIRNLSSMANIYTSIIDQLFSILDTNAPCAVDKVFPCHVFIVFLTILLLPFMQCYVSMEKQAVGLEAI